MSADLGSSFHQAVKWTPQNLAALCGPMAWKSEVPQALGKFKVCRDMETASSPDLGSVSKRPKFPRIASWFASSWKPQVPHIQALLKTPHFHHAVKCGNPWFHQGRDMETPSFLGLGAGARHGNPKFPHAWAPGCDLETPSFPTLGHRRFQSGSDMETPSFPMLGRQGATWKPHVSPRLGTGARLGNPKKFCTGRKPQILFIYFFKPQILGAGWKPQTFGTTWKPQNLGAGRKPQILGVSGSPKF